MEASALNTIYLASAMVIIFLYFIKLKKKNDKYRSVNSMPGPNLWPVFGTALEFYCSPAEAFQRVTKILKASPIGMSRFWIGSPSFPWSYPTVVLTRADTVEPILTNSAITSKGALSYILYDWLGKGSLFSSGGEWHRRRKLLTPTFHFSILQTFFPIMVDQTKVLVYKIESTINDPIDIGQVLSNCTLDIIAQTAMGVDINAQSETKSEYVEALKNLDNIVVGRMGGKIWLLNGFIFSLTKIYKKYREYLDVVHNKSLGVIRERKEKLKAEVKGTNEDDEIPKKRKAFLDLVLEMNALSDQELKEEVNTFMFAGHDTTSATVKWCLFLLGHNEDIQDKVHQELDDILQYNDGDITEDDIRHMKYLECCIKESLRIYPSVPAIDRLLEQDICINGYSIPSGTTVAMNMYVLHRDEKYFPDPEVYDPDRFLAENSAGRSPYAYIPFSAGSRNCIGQKFGMQEAKVLVSMILRRFKVKSLLKREDVTFTRNITLKCEETIYLKFSLRE